MARRRSRIEKRGPHFFIRLLGLLWLSGAIVALSMGFGVWPDGADDWSRFDQGTLIATGVAACLLGGGLMGGKLWVQPAAVLYHLWLALASLFFLFLRWPFEDLRVGLPPTLPPSSWSGVIAFFLLLLAALFLLSSTLLNQRYSWRHFAIRYLEKPNPETLCQSCGATKKEGACPYCGTEPERFYFLQPLVAGAHRVLLPFELGHWRVQIGRDVPWNEARLRHERYKSISRHHANMEMDSKTGELTISPSEYNEIVVNDDPIYTSTQVEPGDIIKLSNVEFVLGTRDNQPVIAYLVSMEDNNLKYRLIFSSEQSERSIGRARDNDVVLPRNWKGISKRHATIIYDSNDQTFYIYNDSKKEGTLRVEGDVVIEPEHNYELGNQRIPLTFDRHDFLFLPLPYEPGINGG